MTTPPLVSGAPASRGRPGPGSGRPGPLARLVAVPVEEFAGTFWGRRELLSRAADLPGDFTDLLTPSGIDELVSTRGLRTPFLRVARNGSTLGERAFTAQGGVGAGIADQVSDDKLVRLFADGATMVLQGLHRVWPPVLEYCQALSAELGHPVQANAYVTPPQSQGFSDHYDVHDVFVLQLAGRKRWRIHSPVHAAPLRNQPWTDRRAEVERRAAEPPALEATLEPGDCLYLPRGFLHAATALGGVSAHLTIGVHTWTRQTLAEQLTAQLLRRLGEDAELRASLPLGVDLTDPDSWRAELDVVLAALGRALADPDRSGLTDRLAEQARGAQRAAPVGPLRQLAAAAELQSGTRLLLRPHLAAGLEHGPDGAVLRSRAEPLRLTEEDVAPVKALLETGDAEVDQLGAGLARRLVLAGLAVLA